MKKSWIERKIINLPTYYLCDYHTWFFIDDLLYICEYDHVPVGAYLYEIDFKTDDLFNSLSIY